MTQNAKKKLYYITFTLEEIIPLVLLNIDIVQDVNSLNNLWNIKDYEYYHEQLEIYYKKIGKEKAPRMSDKLAYIVLLSNTKKKLLESTSIDDYKLFNDQNETDFKIIDYNESEYNENDIEQDEYKNCICSYQNLKNPTLVKNIHTGIKLLIGCECLSRYGLISKNDLKI